MRRRRRRWFREEVIAPWLALAVIVLVWWAGARLIGREETAPPRSAAISPALPAVTPARAKEDAAPEAPRPAVIAAPSAPEPAAEPDAAPVASVVISADVAELKTRGVIVPVAGIDRSELRATFHELRGGGSRRHEALDILAPRGTPVVAAIDGRIEKLFTSKAGGLTLYQFDPEQRYCYYYAHLDRYAPGISEGQVLTRGNVIGYVGTTGNAPPGTPHLHFAIFKLGPDKRWWEGEPIDPFPVLR